MRNLRSRKQERAAPEPHVEEQKQPTQEEELAAVVLKEEEPGSDGEECEIHVYESKFDTRGEQVILRAGTKSEIKPPKPKSHRACLVLTREYDHRGKVLYTVLEIQSRHLMRVLHKVIGNYPGVDCTARTVRLIEPPKCLFHYQDELRRHAQESNNEQEKSHVRLCLQYMERTFHREIKMLKSSGLPELEYRDLWVAFKPGCLVYKTLDGIELISRLASISKQKNGDDDESEHWRLCAEIIQYNGNNVGLRHSYDRIERYAGCKPICDLHAVPLHLHPEEERIRYDLLKRGRKSLSLGGIHHRCHDGMFLARGRDPVSVCVLFLC